MGEKLYFKTEGDYIQKNQAVYQLYSEDLAIAKHDYYSIQTTVYAR
jgi:Cu(I)/Ag(I) efflux system membrane fusion protein